MTYHAVLCFRHDLAQSDSIMEVASVDDSFNGDHFNALGLTTNVGKIVDSSPGSNEFSSQVFCRN